MAANSKTIKGYRSHLNAFMSWRDGAAYLADHVHDAEDLAAITPDEIVGYLTHKAYGTVNPQDGQGPVFARSGTLKAIKKGLSHFMPHRYPWNDVAGNGNPTQHDKVNRLIQRVVVQEVRRQGRPSMAVREFEPEEFEQIIQYCQRDTANANRHLYSSLFRFQLHMIGRIDDVSKTYVTNLVWNNNYPHCLTAKLCWSKNVHTEVDCPFQVVMGANNPLYCVLIGFAIHLETWLASVGMECEFLFGIGGDNNPERTSDNVQKYLAKLLKRQDFNRVRGGHLGTHSIRKMGATMGRLSNFVDDVETRGRWKNSRRMVNTYIGSTLPYPDAKVAAALSRGGPVTYVLHEDSGIPSDEWIAENVVPHITTRFCPEHSALLGRALLWSVYDDETSASIPGWLINQVKTAYQSLPTAMEEGNPIVKRRLLIHGTDGILQVDLMPTGNPNEGPLQGNAPIPTAGPASQEQVLAITHMLQNSLQEIAALHAKQDILMDELKRTRESATSQFRLLRRAPAIGISTRVTPQSPPRVHVQGNTAAHRTAPLAPPGQQGAATMMDSPGNLYLIWTEYTTGIGGRKPVRLFTRRERGGNNKYKIYWRKFVYDIVKDYIRHGIDAQLAIDRIYDVYGRDKPVTHIMRAIQQDKKTYRQDGGRNPQLRI